MKRFLTSCFGLGWLGIAPGTWGSVPPVIIFMVLAYFFRQGTPLIAIMLILAVISSIVCVRFSPVVIDQTGELDPGEIVVDEFAGQAVTLIAGATIVSGQICTVSAAGFLLFRFFDIAKPWPIKRFEKLPKGWGILADDIVAGIYAAVVLLIIHKIGLFAGISSWFCANVQSMNIFTAAILGGVQGLTEFLPVSSSGHLVLFENIFKLNPERPEMLLFDLATHVGTVVAILIVFRKSIRDFFTNLGKSSDYGPGLKRIYQRSPSIHFLTLALIATIVTGALGMFFKSQFEAARGDMVTVGIMWLITGTLLLITDWRKKTRVGLRQFGIIAACIVGLAQAGAIMPGISRSGATICAAILIGLHRRWAVEFSFLLALPAIIGAALFQFISEADVVSSTSVSLPAIIGGTVAAALVGIIALKLLIMVSRSAQLKYFAFYCFALSIGVLTYIKLS